MKKLIIFLIIIAIAALVLFTDLFGSISGDDARDSEDGEAMMEEEDEQEDGDAMTGFTPLGAVEVAPIEHATMVLRWGDEIIYVDPVGGAEAFAGLPVADLVLVTDIHGDHFDEATLSAVTSTDTPVVLPQAVADMLSDEFAADPVIMSNGESAELGALVIEAIPMYNLPEEEDAFHVKGRGNGYVLDDGESRVYIAGDTEDIPEMRALENIDLAFVPMNLPFTMTVEDAADAVIEFAPTRVTPYHYRGRDGFSDIDRFQTLVNEGNSGVEVVLLDWYPEK